MRALAPLLAAAGLLGCAGARPPAADGRTVRIPVPFFADRTDQCGPSALASVLRFWGDGAEPGLLRGEVYRAGLQGSLPVDLLLAARARGMDARVLEGGLRRVQEELDAGHPVIAFVNRGLRAYPIGHYLVLTGYDEARRGLYAHSGVERDAFVPYGRFEREWEKTEHWALLVLPPGR